MQGVADSCRKKKCNLDTAWPRAALKYYALTNAEQCIIKKAHKLQYNKEQEASTNHTFNVNFRNNIHILSTKS